MDPVTSEGFSQMIPPPDASSAPSESGHGIDQRTITGVSRMADGWSIEVEDAVGIRLAYWLADTGCVPHVGDSVTFYGGVLGQPLHGIEINGCRVYYDAAD